MEEPRWLSDDEQHAWRRLAAVILKLPAALEAQLQRDARMSHFEYWVIALLSEAPQRTLRLSQLAAQANASLSRLSHVVSRLEGRGWVTRRPCPDDAGATLAMLTDDGCTPRSRISARSRRRTATSRPPVPHNRPVRSTGPTSRLHAHPQG
jgi:DNA-binding MarR family transcriptional regulator